MTLTFFGTRSQGTTAEDEVVPSQAEIDREIRKLKEDSARDVQRQLEQQRLAARGGRVEDGVKRVAEDVEGGFAPVWKAAEQEVEMIVEGAEADVKGVRGFGTSVKSAEKGRSDESRKGKRRE